MTSLAALWAFAPPAPAPVALARPTPPEPANPEVVETSLDPAAFSARLWNPPPAPAVARPPAPPAPPPPPLRLQLLGIIREPTPDGASVLRAALYDPDEDQVLIVASGDRLGRRTITRITERTVEIAEGSRTHTLRLDDEPSRGGRS